MVQTPTAQATGHAAANIRPRRSQSHEEILPQVSGQGSAAGPVTHDYNTGCPDSQRQREGRSDLSLLDMTDFGVIMGMDWLSPYHAILDCRAKTITLVMPELPRFEWKGSSVNATSRVISFLKARYMVKKGCLAYLSYVRDTTVPPISIIPYRMDLKQLKELKELLEELLAKGFVRLSISHWGAPVLFVMNKDGTMRIFLDYR
uniref:Uncharacterized protein LOC104224138 n=1 Tax=Nicotiana sylvestris TaxID=4096 RepID=A0A1U7W1V2_NICSY|nr:PREDICTED: uncharacterized protein LOC104224138 [Nicotiana sylvestris]